MDLYGRLIIGFLSNSWKVDCYWLGCDVCMIKLLVRSKFILCVLIFMKYVLKYVSFEFKKLV